MVTLVQAQASIDLSEVELPWDIPALPEHTAAVVEHARRLSLFARGTTLQYYRMLIEKKGVEDAGAADAFATWWEAEQTQKRKQEQKPKRWSPRRGPGDVSPELRGFR